MMWPSHVWYGESTGYEGGLEEVIPRSKAKGERAPSSQQVPDQRSELFEGLVKTERWPRYQRLHESLVINL